MAGGGARSRVALDSAFPVRWGEFSQQPFRYDADRLAHRGGEGGTGVEAAALDAVADQPPGQAAQGPAQLDGVGDAERLRAAGPEPFRQRVPVRGPGR